MIAHIQGRLVEKTPTEVVIDCNGVGYHINISLHTFSLIPDSENLKLYIFLQIKEDSHSLFGFVEKQERELFKLLLSVSGVGASTARTMLSSLAPAQIIQAIAANDVTTIQSMKGIGAKTAERIIIDLRDKVQKFEISGEENVGFIDNKIKEESLSALEVLGIPKKMSEKIADRILKQSPDIQVEDLIKQILKNI